MGIYIPNMEMPTESWHIVISRNGDVTLYNQFPSRGIPWSIERGLAIPVPPHGALMDRDDFFTTCPELVDGYKCITDDLVVIPAEEVET